MLWKRMIVAWMTLLALAFASLGATARADVSPKTHVGAIDLVAAVCIEASGLASAEGYRGNWDPATTGTSDVPHAARGAGESGKSIEKGKRPGKLSAREAGEQVEGIKSRQGELRKQGKGEAIRSTKKSEQKERSAHKQIRTLQDALDEYEDHD